MQSTLNFHRLFGVLFEALFLEHHPKNHYPEIYRNHSLPLSSLAELRNCSVLKFWNEISGIGGRFYCLTNGLEKVLRDCEALAVEGSLVLDSTALACINFLNIGDYVVHRFPRLLVPRAVWQDIHDFWREETLGPQAKGYLWHDGAQLRYSEVDANDLERRRNFLKSIVDFVKTHCEVVPVAGLVEEMDWAKAIGKASVAAVLLAKERAIPLWSDDQRLRQFAQHNFQAKTTYFWPLLVQLRAHGFTSDQMSESLCRLTLHGYSNTSLPAEILVERLRVEKFEMTRETKVILFRTFNGHDLNVKYASEQLARFIHALWIKHPLESKFRSIFFEVLDSYVFERSTPTALNELRSQLNTYFHRERFSLTFVLKDLQIWEDNSLRVINRGALLEVGQIQVAPLDLSLRFAHPEFRRAQ